METTQKYFESYKVKVTINKEDYSDSLTKIRLVSTLNHVYPLVNLSMTISPSDIILKSIYGQDPIFIDIILTNDMGITISELKLELMYIQSGFQMAMEPNNTEEKQQDRSYIEILTVCRNAYKTMTTLVNEIYEYQTLRTMITNLTNSQTDATVEYSTLGENTNKIDQVLIPPITYEEAIYYLDKTFGLYNGPMVLFCDISNKVHIRNLAKEISKKSNITIYYLSLDSKENDDIVKKCSDGEFFYTTIPITSNYVGNSRFSVLSSDIKYIVNPSDRLYSSIDINLTDLCKNYGVISNNRSIPFDSIMNRTKYIINNPGYSTNMRDTESFAISRISKSICDLSTLELSLTGFIKVARLLEVGRCVEFVPQIINYIPLSGKYILKTSDITFKQINNKEWATSANLYLFRTNKVI